MVFYGPIIETVYIQGNIYRKYIIRQDMHNVKSYSVSFVSSRSESIVSLPRFHIFKISLFLLSQHSPHCHYYYCYSYVCQCFLGRRNRIYYEQMCKDVVIVEEQGLLSILRVKNKKESVQVQGNFYTILFSHVFEFMCYTRLYFVSIQISKNL